MYKSEADVGRHVMVLLCTGPGLVFVVYPAAIARMPGSPVWAALFFVFLFTVGVDSQVKALIENCFNQFFYTFYDKILTQMHHRLCASAALFTSD